MFRCVLLYRTTFSRTVKHLQLGVNYFLYQLVGFGSEHRTLWILFKDFDARFVYEKGVVKNLKLVVEHAKRVALRHLVALSLPAQSFVVVRIRVRSNVDWLPVHEVTRPLSNVKDSEF